MNESKGFFSELIDRIKGESPDFFKFIGKVGWVLGTIGVGLAAAPAGVRIPEFLVNIGSYMATAGYVIGLFSNLPVKDKSK